jgi:YgiT-type zinc finger domain-containing protein
MSDNDDRIDNDDDTLLLDLPEGIQPPVRMTAERAAKMRCLECGTEEAFRLQTVEEEVREGDDFVLVPVPAAVCVVCGNRVLDAYAATTVDRVAEGIAGGDRGGLRPVGTVYRVG